MAGHDHQLTTFEQQAEEARQAIKTLEDYVAGKLKEFRKGATLEEISAERRTAKGEMLEHDKALTELKKTLKAMAKEKENRELEITATQDRLTAIKAVEIACGAYKRLLGSKDAEKKPKSRLNEYYAEISARVNSTINELVARDAVLAADQATGDLNSRAVGAHMRHIDTQKKVLQALVDALQPMLAAKEVEKVSPEAPAKPPEAPRSPPDDDSADDETPKSKLAKYITGISLKSTACSKAIEAMDTLLKEARAWTSDELLSAQGHHAGLLTSYTQILLEIEADSDKVNKMLDDQARGRETQALFDQQTPVEAQCGVVVIGFHRLKKKIEDAKKKAQEVLDMLEAVVVPSKKKAQKAERTTHDGWWWDWDSVEKKWVPDCPVVKAADAADAASEIAERRKESPVKKKAKSGNVPLARVKQGVIKLDEHPAPEKKRKDRDDRPKQPAQELEFFKLDKHGNRTKQYKHVIMEALLVKPFDEKIHGVYLKLLKIIDEKEGAPLVWPGWTGKPGKNGPVESYINCIEWSLTAIVRAWRVGMCCLVPAGVARGAGGQELIKHLTTLPKFLRFLRNCPEGGYAWEPVAINYITENAGKDAFPKGHRGLPVCCDNMMRWIESELRHIRAREYETLEDFMADWPERWDFLSCILRIQGSTDNGPSKDLRKYVKYTLGRTSDMDTLDACRARVKARTEKKKACKRTGVPYESDDDDECDDGNHEDDGEVSKKSRKSASKNDENDGENDDGTDEDENDDGTDEDENDDGTDEDDVRVSQKSKKPAPAKSKKQAPVQRQKVASRRDQVSESEESDEGEDDAEGEGSNGDFEFVDDAEGDESPAQQKPASDEEGSEEEQIAQEEPVSNKPERASAKPAQVSSDEEGSEEEQIDQEKPVRKRLAPVSSDEEEQVAQEELVSKKPKRASEKSVRKKTGRNKPAVISSDEEDSEKHELKRLRPMPAAPAAPAPTPPAKPLAKPKTPAQPPAAPYKNAVRMD